MRRHLAERSSLIAAALVAVLCMAPPLLGADGGISKAGVRDLYYGETLFHFYQQDHFTALTHLMAARKAGRLKHHIDDGELLLGGLYLSYGQHDQASAIFNRLLASVSEPAVRNQAWFYLGKVRYQRGVYASAVAAFENVHGELSGDLASELRMLKAQSFLALGEYARAADTLDAWQGSGSWKAYANYNLGVALIRLGQVVEGAGRLDHVGQISTTNPELISLRDKANVALGYTHLQNNQPVMAREVLRRVRLNGPFSSKALLGVGWADVAQEDFRSALTPWLELQERDLLDSAVQESWLAVPYAFQQLSANGSAVESYESALVAFDREILQLDQAIKRADSGELISALLELDDPEIGRWSWQLEKIPDSTDARYLYFMIADHRFQEGLRNTRDLAALRWHLDQWQKKLDAFEDMLDARRQAFEEQLPKTRTRLAEVDLPQLQAGRDALAQRLADIEAARNVLGVASDEEVRAWQQLSKLEAYPAWSHRESTGARHKQRVLKGLVLWNAEREYEYRVWQQHRQLDGLDRELHRAGELTAASEKAQISDPNVRAEYQQRIDQLRVYIAELQGRIAAALGGQERALQVLAAGELEARKNRLATYQLQARFALASIYDRSTAAAGRKNSP